MTAGWIERRAEEAEAAKSSHFRFFFFLIWLEIKIRAIDQITRNSNRMELRSQNVSGLWIISSYDSGFRFNCGASLAKMQSLENHSSFLFYRIVKLIFGDFRPFNSFRLTTSVRHNHMWSERKRTMPEIWKDHAVLQHGLRSDNDARNIQKMLFTKSASLFMVSCIGRRETAFQWEI